MRKCSECKYFSVEGYITSIWGEGFGNCEKFDNWEFYHIVSVITDDCELNEED